MKRLFALLLVLTLLLCACGTEPADVPSTEPSTDTPTQNTQVPTQEDPSEDPTEESTEPVTEPQLLYQNPLNGEAIAEPYTGRPVAVVINNIQNALPQYGISQADFIYELVTEGGITRCLAVFSDVSDVGTIGPVRSTRTFFNNIALSYDAPLIHCGGSQPGLAGHYDENGIRIDGWQHINEQYYGQYFFRDHVRYESGYSWEHTLFTSGELVSQALTDKGYTQHDDRFLALQPENVNYGLQFADVVALDGESATDLTINFRYGKTTSMTWNPETGLYEASQYGSDHIDAATGKTLAYRNVLVLCTSQWSVYEGDYDRSFYDLSGSGNGYFICDGQIVPITWHRDETRGSFTYTLEDGTPITLGVGSTYVGITAAKDSVVYE